MGRLQESDADEPVAAPASINEGDFYPGILVRHPTFGLGVVAEVNRRGVNTTVKVDFDEVGTKSLMLRLARLEHAG
jgi:hypothetical protein